MVLLGGVSNPRKKQPKPVFDFRGADFGIRAVERIGSILETCDYLHGKGSTTSAA